MTQKTTDGTVFEASEQAKITKDLEASCWVNKAMATDEKVVVELDCLNTDNIKHVFDRYDLEIQSVSGIDTDGGIRSDVDGLVVQLGKKGDSQ